MPAFMVAASNLSKRDPLSMQMVEILAPISNIDLKDKVGRTASEFGPANGEMSRADALRFMALAKTPHALAGHESFVAKLDQLRKKERLAKKTTARTLARKEA